MVAGSSSVDVTVRGSSDSLPGTSSVVSLGAVSSLDAAFHGQTLSQTVVVTIIEAGTISAAPSALRVPVQGGASQTLTLTLSQPPRQRVTVPVTVPPQIVLNVGNAVVFESDVSSVDVVVSGAGSETIDNASLLFGRSSSSDVRFEGVQPLPERVQVEVVAMGVLSLPSSMLVAVSEGTATTINITANPPPISSVTFALTLPSSLTLLSPSAPSLVLSPSKPWVELSVIGSASSAPGSSGSVVFSAGVSDDVAWTGVVPPSIQFDVVALGSISSSSSSLRIGTVGGGSGELSLSLSPAPASSVRVPISFDQQLLSLTTDNDALSLVGSQWYLDIAPSTSSLSLGVSSSSSSPSSLSLQFGAIESEDVRFRGVKLGAVAVQVVQRGVLSLSPSSIRVPVSGFSEQSLTLSASSAPLSDVVITIDAYPDQWIAFPLGLAYTLPAGQLNISFPVHAVAAVPSNGVIPLSVSFAPSSSPDANASTPVVSVEVVAFGTSLH